MNPAEPVHYITEEEYLEGEQRAEVKHEYFDGQVYPLVRQGFGPVESMAGASEEHELVALNVATALVNHLRGKGCRVYKSDMRLRVKFRDKTLYHYPDVMVTCDPSDAHPLFRERPKLIVEVLSDDWKKDFVEKAAVYAQIPTLEEYVMITPRKEAPLVQISRRDPGWDQLETVRGLQAAFTLKSVGLLLPITELFAV